MTIEIIEDDVLLSKVLTDEFTEKGHTVYTAHDGEEGLDLMRKKKVDIVLLDLLMPKMNGITLLEEKKRDPSIKDIPVVVMTISENQETLNRTFELGARDAMIKSEYTVSAIVERAEALSSRP